MRDSAGTTVDFRIDFLSVAADEDKCGEVAGKGLLAVAPSLADSRLFKCFSRLADSGGTFNDEFDVEGSATESPRRLMMQGFWIKDRVVAHWRDAIEQERSKVAVEQRIAERTARAEARSDQLRYLALALADAEARERKRLAGILHDHFQQLLSAAKLKAGMVRRAAQEPSVQAGVQQIEGLLEAAIAESRALTIELCPPLLYDAGLHAALDALARTFRPRRGLRVVVDAHPDAEPATEQIRVLLYEAIRELLENVVTHAETDHARVETTLLPNGQIQVSVSDEGKGFDVGLMIDRSGQIDHSRLGMLELRERLQFLGGDLRVESTPGQGTRVRAIVPAEIRVTTLQPTVQPTSAATHLLRRDFTPRNGPARVLVADDHAIFREGLVALMKQEPRLTVVAEAADGEQAVELARQLLPDIVLLDINMPKLSGVEAARIISRENPNVRIVGLSMHQQEDMAETMSAAGAVAYVTKAEASDALLEILRKLL